MKRLAIIPAREGSKRIPLKNIKDFCGKPMISHVLQACTQSGIFDKIHVSTDSDQIIDIVSRQGIKTDFKRPADLSGDHTSMMEVLRYVVEEYAAKGERFDTVALLYATSPIVAAQDLKNACKEFESGDLQKPVLAVAPYPAPVEHAFRMGEDTTLAPADKDALAMRTQDLKQAYYDAGMFAFYTADFIKAQKAAGNFSAFRGYVVPSYRVTDIDWPEDWDHAEMLFKAVAGAA